MWALLPPFYDILIKCTYLRFEWKYSNKNFRECSEGQYDDITEYISNHSQDGSDQGWLTVVVGSVGVPISYAPIKKPMAWESDKLEDQLPFFRGSGGCLSK